jgi:hypothetical protein
MTKPLYQPSVVLQIFIYLSPFFTAFNAKSLLSKTKTWFAVCSAETYAIIACFSCMIQLFRPI